MSELEPYVAGSRPGPDFERVLREVSDLEAEEEPDIEDIMGSLRRRNQMLHYVDQLGYPRKKGWTFKPYENPSEAARNKLRLFHERNPRALRVHQLGQRDQEQDREPERELEPKQG